jgi:hypothetical protein
MKKTRSKKSRDTVPLKTQLTVIYKEGIEQRESQRDTGLVVFAMDILRSMLLHRVI